MAKLNRVELEKRCQSLLADGQQVTTRIEQLLQGSEPMETGQFDRKLKRLRRDGDEIHRQLEQAMAELQALDGKP